MNLYNVIYCDLNGFVRSFRVRANDEEEAEGQAWFDLDNINYVIEVKPVE